jgi:hypothetical protein
MYVYHISFIHSSVDRHLSGSRILATVNCAAVSMAVQVSLLDAELHSFRYTQESYSWIIR